MWKVDCRRNAVRLTQMRPNLRKNKPAAYVWYVDCRRNAVRPVSAYPENGGAGIADARVRLGSGGGTQLPFSFSSSAIMSPSFTRASAESDCVRGASSEVIVTPQRLCAAHVFHILFSRACPLWRRHPAPIQLIQCDHIPLIPRASAKPSRWCVYRDFIRRQHGTTKIVCSTNSPFVFIRRFVHPRVCRARHMRKRGSVRQQHNTTYARCADTIPFVSSFGKFLRAILSDRRRRFQRAALQRVHAWV